jgi:hypothetical protein
MSKMFVSWLEGDAMPTPTPMCWPEESARLPLPEAVLVILFRAASCDHSAGPAESELLQALTRRWSVRRVLREKNITALDYAALAHVSSETAIRDACAVIPPALRGAVFANAVDICLSDGALKREEAVFLDELADELGLAGEEAKRIGEVIALKNIC